MISPCWKKAVMMLAIYYALLFIGAAIIMYIEADGLAPQDSFNATEKLNNFFTLQFNIRFNESSLSEILQLSSRISTKMKKIENQKWKREKSWKAFYKWRYFTHITLTTVGFGDIVPETDGGKIFLIIYATIGIPVNVLVTAIIGCLLSVSISKLINGIERKLFSVSAVKKMELKTCAILLAMIIAWLAIGARMTLGTMKWSWVEGFYAAFVTFSTIGYGDYTLDFSKLKAFNELLSWYTNVGLAIVAGLLDAITRYMKPPEDGRECHEFLETNVIALQENKLAKNVERNRQRKITRE